ncbi:YsnF/AvaK domain-containing protein [Leptolyngbya sp. NIES-2104]|uniref:YsnF/AvaK domain-containing protein n=1 Tax=Leptolyngbya sp. NIES-2104 TaxID=1552121 RepID=UPI0006EC5127|nr:YsnF/AvaK domain-containing protein [Leptolyngbya sp. NIES-2104]GAP94120.1 signal transduction histidine kinase [Leptolyngbya sp. NIES-2104]
MVVGQMRHAVGTFPTRQAADHALTELRQSNFPMNRVSVVAKDHDRVAGVETTERMGNKADDGAKAGATTGGLLGGIGGLLVGLGLLAIPGIGPVMLAGAAETALVTALSGAAIGAATGGLGGALIGLGIPEREAKHYSDRVEAGHYLVMVEGTDAEIARAEAILSHRGIESWGVYDAPNASRSVMPTVATPAMVPLEASLPLEASAPLGGFAPVAPVVESVKPAPVVEPTPVAAVEPDPMPVVAPEVQPVREDDAIRLHEERLIADKHRVKSGEVTVGKYIETQTEQVSVPIERERVVIEHMEPTTLTPIAPDQVQFGQDVARVEVYEEVPEIRKEAFVREEVRIHKEVDRQVAQVEDTIRREELDVDVDGNPIVQTPDRDIRR